MALLLYLALSPWAAPEPDAATSTPAATMVCTDVGVQPRWTPAAKASVLAPLPAGSSTTATPPSQTGGSNGDIKAAHIERGASPTALIAVGSVLKVAGGTMAAAAPPVYMIDEADGPMPRVRYGWSSASHTKKDLAVGIAGVLLDAIGTKVLERGIEKRRRRRP